MIRISFKQTQEISGVSSRQIRNWLTRKIRLDADKERLDGRRHRRFTFLDCLRLAFIARLTASGFTAADASRKFEAIIKIAKRLPTPKNVSASEMKRIFWVMGYHVAVLGFDPATNKRELDFILVHAEKDIWKEINKTEWDSYLIVHLHILTLGIFLRSLSLWSSQGCCRDFPWKAR